jgi:hypothetical protein
MGSPTVLHRLNRCPSTIAREHTHTHTLLNNIIFAIIGAVFSVTSSNQCLRNI